MIEAGHHGGAWKVAYADFVTAMMASFLLMWLLSATTEDHRKGLVDYFSPNSLLGHASSGTGQPFGGHSVFDQGPMVSDCRAVQVIVGMRRVVDDPPDDDDTPPTADQHGAAAEAGPAGKLDSGPRALPRRPPQCRGPVPSQSPSQARPDRRTPRTHRPKAGPIDMPQPTRADTSQAARANVSVDAPRTDAPAGAQVVARLDTASGARAPTAADLRAEHERQEKPAFEQAAAQLRQAVRHDPALAALSRQLAIDITPEGLRIQLLDEDWTAMFVTGSATPNDRVRLLLLYGRENNGWIVHLINPLRRALFSRMSLRLVHALSSPLTAPLWCALRVGLPHGAYYRLIRRFSLEHLRAIVFDHMIPRMALCYTRAEAEALLERVGLTDVRSIWVNEDAWSAIGRRAGG